MDERCLKPKNIQSANDLHKLPVLTKDILRASWNDLRAANISDKFTFIATTGGSTGEPMRIAKGVNTEAWARMLFERGLSWGGLRPGTKCILLRGGSLGVQRSTVIQRVRDRLSGVVNLAAFDLREDRVTEYSAFVRKSGAQFIIGYASSIYLFARLLLACGEKLKLHAVFTTSERLSPRWADVIREAMDCKVYSYYGCGECNSIAYQCQEGASYHTAEEHVILEAESRSGETSCVGPGAALITDLDNYTMPLLRYRNGDYLSLSDDQCSCRRPARLISKLEGRICEFLLSATGQCVSAGICDYIMGNVDGVNEFQVRQRSLVHIRVFVITRKSLTEEQSAYIRQSFRYYLGDEVNVEIQQTDTIPRTRAQKLQTAVNEVQNNW